MSFNSIPEILEDIRAGRMVVILDDEDRENEGDLIMAASMVRPEDINFMAKEARGLICLAMTQSRCQQLRLPLMVSDNRSQHGTKFTVSIEAAEGVTTGISAYDRAHTIRTAVRPDAKPDDLHQPGHVFPLMAQAGGALLRAGHTEAAVDLALLAGLEPAGVLVEVMSDDGSMARRPELEKFAQKHGLKIGTIADLIGYRLETETTIERIEDKTVETEFGAFRICAYRDRISDAVHFAMVKGEIDPNTPLLVRVQPLNLLSDVMHIRRSDLANSAHQALAQISKAGCGVLVILADPQASQKALERLLSKSVEEAEASAQIWRRNGVGAQILADLGAKKLSVLGAQRRYFGLKGFGLEVVEYAEPDES